MLGNKIKELRRKKKLTQSELAKMLDVSTGAVCFWEIEKREPSQNKLIEISKLFGVSIDYLLNNEQENNVTILGRNGTYKKFKLSEKNIKAIEMLAETMDDNLK